MDIDFPAPRMAGSAMGYQSEQAGDGAPPMATLGLIGQVASRLGAGRELTQVVQIQ